MTENETTAITINNVTSAQAGSMITSFKAEPGDRAQAVRIYNALNNPSDRVANHINEVLSIRDYLIEITTIEDVDSMGNGLGTYTKVPRVVLVTEDGTSYQAVSFGMYTAIRNVVAVCGDAPWEPAVQLKVKQVPTKRGSMLTCEMVG